MKTAIERYRAFLDKFVEARRVAGGALSHEEEERRMDALDRLWWSLTDEEQDEYERTRV